MANLRQTSALLGEPERHPLLSPSMVGYLGSTLVITPHPAAATLACGGLLALLAVEGIRAEVAVTTDGSHSHPASASVPADRLPTPWEVETREALSALGSDGTARFLRFAGHGLPAPGSPAFEKALATIRKMMFDLAPDTVLVPWPGGPSGDHSATWNLMGAAARDWGRPLRWIEYPLGAWAQPWAHEAPRSNTHRAWRLDISPVAAEKKSAIACHRSQFGEKPPIGSPWQPEDLAIFHRPWELFLEPISRL